MSRYYNVNELNNNNITYEVSDSKCTSEYNFSMHEYAFSFTDIHYYSEPCGQLRLSNDV